MNVCGIPHTDLKISRIVYGCMGIGSRWDREPGAASCLADGVEMSREEWYQLFTAARGSPLS